MCGPVALLSSGAAGAVGVVDVSGAVGDPAGAPVVAVSWWMGGAVGVGAGLACSGLVSVLGVVASLAGVVCGAVLRCAAVAGLAACCVCVVPVVGFPEGSGSVAVMVMHTAMLTRMLKMPKVPLPLLSLGPDRAPECVVVFS